MDRRNFLRTATAAGLLPLLPAIPATRAAAAVAAPVVNDFMYGMAVFNARLRGVSSPDKICRDLGIAKDAATGLQTRLLNDGFINLPNAAGVSRTSEPFAQTLGWRRKTTEKLKEIAQQKFEAVKDEVLAEDDAPLTDPASPTEPT